MHIGTQFEAPEGLGSLRSDVRYYFGGGRERDVLFVSLEQTSTNRWKAHCIRVDRELFERELMASPPGLRLCAEQYTLPPSLRGLEGLDSESSLDGQPNKVAGRIDSRLGAIKHLLDAERQIIDSDRPLSVIARLSRSVQSKVHIFDLGYWFFSFVLHGRRRLALMWSTHLNGRWSRDEGANAAKKFGRPSLAGARKGWPSGPMRRAIVDSYLRHAKPGASMSQIHRRAMADDFGCSVRVDGAGKRELFHELNRPFPSCGQYRYQIEKEFGRQKIRQNKYGPEKLRRQAIVDAGNVTGRLRNILESVEADAYWTADCARPYRGDVPLRLVVVRAIDGLTSACVGIGFAVDGERAEAYRAMLWSMATPKAIVADVYGLDQGALDWPMIGMTRAFLSDRGPGGTKDLVPDLMRQFPIKSLTAAWDPRDKPIVESSNPRSFDSEGAPHYDQSELMLAEMMKREVLRAAAENRTKNIVEKLSPQMVADFHDQQLPATPANLWKYLEDRMRTSSVSMTPEQAVRTFLRPVTLSVDRVGVIWSGIHYNSPDLIESGEFERMVRAGTNEVRGYTLSLVGRVIWIECFGRLVQLRALKRIKHSDDELNISSAEVHHLDQARRELRSLTRLSTEAAHVELQLTVQEQTGLPLGEADRVAKRKPARRGAKAQVAALTGKKINRLA